MADYRVVNSIAVIEINNPPVNALSFGVRKGLYDGVQKANADNKVTAIVIIGKGKTFPSGADIKEFNNPHTLPGLIDVGRRIEDSSKPVVAAIHGTCYGGGLEVALFSHYRLAVASAKVAFPEVKLGILPGANGTQRLPRVAGIPFALEMIISGRPVSAKVAFKNGIIDKIVDGDLLSDSIKYAASLHSVPHNRRLKNISVKNVPNEIYEAALAQIKRKQKGFIAPINCLKAVKASAELPYEQGIARELELITELMNTPQANALQYAFFADRAAPRWNVSQAMNYKVSEAISIRSTGVLGAGTMGSGIAVTLLTAGIPVTLVEQDAKFLDKGVETIKSILQGSVRLKRMTQAQMNQRLQLLKPATSIESLRNSDLIIEAVYENLKLKQDIFSKLDKICKPETILCSNTSTLDIDKIACVTSRPDKVIGTHFFAPAFVMPLLENVYGAETSGTTIATVMKLGKTIRKIPVLVKTCTGFVGNRMFHKYGAEASFMAEEGCLPHEVDETLEDFGMAMGSFKVSDLSGIDVGWKVRQEKAKSGGYSINANTKYIDGERYCPLRDRLYEAGRFGRKTGKGWYRYEKAGGKEAYIDPDIDSLILNYCRESGITRRKISTQEIIERCLYSSINEGFKCLEDGIAAKPEDIDVIWLYGFGFPRYRGGPMFYANQVGLDKVYERIEYYHRTFPESSHWVPSDMLRKLASFGRNVPLSEWMNTTTSVSSRL